MDRIPQAWIDECVGRVDLVNLVESRVTLKKSGARFVARCPFHAEKSPSFGVSRDKQFYHCFGCGAHGNAIGWLMAYDRMTFLEALEHLADLAGMEIPRQVATVAAAAPDLSEMYRVQQSAAHFYRQALRYSREAIDYLRQRGLDGDTARRYHIGWAPAGWRNLPANWDRAPMQAAGLIVADERRLYDRFRARVMFPVRDPRGRVLAFSGRVVDPAASPKYLNSPESPVFAKHRTVYGLYECLQAQPRPAEIIVVEGNLDAVLLARHGINHAVATLGTAIGPDHVHLLYRYTGRLVFCLDGDEAGRKASVRAMEAVLPALQPGRLASFATLPDGHDPASFVLAHGADAFRELIQHAAPLSDYLFEAAAKGSDLQSFEGLAFMAGNARRWIDQIADPDRRQLMSYALAGMMGRKRPRFRSARLFAPRCQA